MKKAKSSEVIGVGIFVVGMILIVAAAQYGIYLFAEAAYLFMYPDNPELAKNLSIFTVVASGIFAGLIFIKMITRIFFPTKNYTNGSKDTAQATGGGGDKTFTDCDGGDGGGGD